MWRKGNATGCFRPREPIVIYAPENDPLPTWNIKNHARTWKFRKNEKAGRRWRWRWQWRLGGEAIVAWTRRRLAPRWPETQRSQSRRWPCRSVSGGRSDCNLVVNWIYGATFQKNKKKRRSGGKNRATIFIVLQYRFLPLPHTLSRTTVSYLKSSAAWETIPVEANKVNSCQLRVTHESKTAFGLFMTARTRELQPSSYLPPSLVALLNPFVHGVASMLIVCLLFACCHSRREVNTRVNMLAFTKSQTIVCLFCRR